MSIAELVDPRADRAAWLERRRRGLGASEIAAVMGLSPFATPLDIYARKLGLEPEQAETMPMRIGRRLEGGLAGLYEDETGRRIVREQVEAECPTVPYLIATLDAIRDDGRPVELKTTGSARAGEIGEPGTDELPPHFLLQGQHQMLVADADVMDFAVLLGGRALDFRVFTVRRDEALAAAILEAAAAFWDMVISRAPPPISAPSDLRHLRLFGDNSEPVLLDEATDSAWLQFDVLGREVARLTKQRDQLRAQLHAALGASSVGLLPSGGRLVRKLVDRKEYTVQAAKYPTLTYKGD